MQGVHTKHYWNLLGKLAVEDLERGTPMKLEYAEATPQLPSNWLVPIAIVGLCSLVAGARWMGRH